MSDSAFFQAPFPAKVPSQNISSSHSYSLRRLRYAQPGRRRIYLRCCETPTDESKYEPVEDGIQLPTVRSETLETHTSWLEIEVTSWLDSEWPEKVAVKAHKEIGFRVAQIYRRLRAEGVNDLSSLLLGIGDGLEGADFSKTYTGPWNVANKSAELLLERFSPDRFVSEEDKPRPEAGKEHWSVLDEIEKHNNNDDDDDDDEPRRPTSPSLADEFERYRFLQMVLDGTASKSLIDGAIAVAMGFQYDMRTGAWDGSDVADEHFKKFGNDPPDVLGNETESTWTDTLVHLEKQLGLDEDVEGKLEASLMAVLETLHGTELTKIQMNDKDDHAFKKRATAAKWLHLLGGF